VNVEEADGMAHGSGTLVDVREQYGMVMTNWHVVCDATGTISVVFPDGFRSAARVVRADRDWDLAALLIWRPRVAPVTIATQAPRPGEMLTIAGYGSGDYQAQTGACTQYVAPSQRHPFEMVEVAAKARQGDSGGPILNTSGELAGVLFGSGGGTTSGSYGGRVQQFMQGIWPPDLGAQPGTGVVARRALPDAGPSIIPGSLDGPPPAAERLQTIPQPSRGGSLSSVDGPPYTTASDAHGLAPLPQLPGHTTADAAVLERQSAAFASADQLSPAQSQPQPGSGFDWRRLAGDSLTEQGKTFLAILGLFSLIAHCSRLLARPAQ
jgi:S1-C subfamily serine protease